MDVSYTQMNINITSVRGVLIRAYTDETEYELGSASGFLCTYKHRYFLVTNWHVFSGKNFETKELINSNAAIPEKIDFEFASMTEKDGDRFRPIRVLGNKIPLYHDGEPLYRTHPSNGSDYDVSVLELDLIPQINDSTFDVSKEISKESKLAVMDQVFIVGYPLKTSTTPNDYPIYKAATVASEPDIYSKPLFYVDGKTKKGMSGSPVIKKHGIKFDGVTFTEGRIDLVGIYSGRNGATSDESEAELGIVWHLKECVIPILESYDNDS